MLAKERRLTRDGYKGRITSISLGMRLVLPEYKLFVWHWNVWQQSQSQQTVAMRSLTLTARIPAVL